MMLTIEVDCKFEKFRVKFSKCTNRDAAPFNTVDFVVVGSGAGVNCAIAVVVVQTEQRRSSRMGNKL